MPIIDTHCHYNLPPLAENWQEHWKKAQECGVEKSIIVGTNVETSQLAIDQASTDKNLYASVGIHPNYYTRLVKTEKTEITESQLIQWQHHIDHQIKSLKKMVDSHTPIAIGEAGLDYFQLKNKGQKRSAIIALQEYSFTQQIELAQKDELPLIIHTRDKVGKEEAYWDTLKILKEYRVEKFVLHCFSGPAEYISEAIKLGGYVGVDGNITYDSSDNLRKILEKIPKDRILLETDAPYLPPKGENIPDNPDICEPWMIEETVTYLEKNIEITTESTKENSSIFFQI